MRFEYDFFSPTDWPCARCDSTDAHEGDGRMSAAIQNTMENNREIILVAVSLSGDGRGGERKVYFSRTTNNGEFEQEFLSWPPSAKATVFPQKFHFSTRSPSCAAVKTPIHSMIAIV